MSRVKVQESRIPGRLTDNRQTDTERERQEIQEPKARAQSSSSLVTTTTTKKLHGQIV